MSDFISDTIARLDARRLRTAVDGLVTAVKALDHFREALKRIADPEFFGDDAQRIAYAQAVLDTEHDL